MRAPHRPGTQSPPLNAKETQAAIGRDSCRAKLLREFSKGPLTASEAAAAALQGENPTAPKFETYRKCVSELKAKRFIEDSWERRNKSIVWQITELGRTVLTQMP